MNKVLMGALACIIGFALVATPAHAYNYGDYKSSTLISKAWQALEAGDMDAVMAYTKKCFELYEKKAKEMQEGLTDYVAGENAEIFKMWALNDVSTGYYIQGEAYRKAGMKEEAKAAYQKVVKEFGYGQCWDVGGWFWKPAEAAKEKLAMIESGSQIDYGDYKSSTLTTKAWDALAAEDLDSVKAYVSKNLELYEEKAKEMQNSLTEYPWESNEKIFSYWALNDVGASLFILGEAYFRAGDMAKAKEAFQRLVDEFYYAQCWDPGDGTTGWFWKPADAAQGKLSEMSE
jgi:tetratricopeptide (TPR) repeat protein